MTRKILRSKFSFLDKREGIVTFFFHLNSNTFCVMLWKNKTQKLFRMQPLIAKRGELIGRFFFYPFYFFFFLPSSNKTNKMPTI